MNLDHVLKIIELHPASFIKAFPDRIVNNIYFDSPSMTCLNENLMGVATRKKFRLRWYGNNYQQLINPKLEIKFKENELGGKKILDMDNHTLRELNTIKTAVNNKLNNKYILKPVLFNSYHRSYWMTRKFRITIDSRLTFHPLFHSSAFYNFICQDNVIVVELKYEKEFDNEVKDITSFLPFRLSKNSKYVNGILLTR